MATLLSIQFSTYEYEFPTCLNPNNNDPNSFFYDKDDVNKMKKCAFRLINGNLANVTRENFQDTLSGVVNWLINGNDYKIGKQYYIKVDFDLRYKNPQSIWTIMQNGYVVGPLQVNSVGQTSESSDAKHHYEHNFSRYYFTLIISFFLFLKRINEL
ncbi:hypothetical protein C1645_741792 [Glomus cerebriforme]|uniref:Uncharacterized protein n=1 Tax=Glomus cerebriforme TaxID=658196 RepID=A0A397SGL2_9GLOM|nr:hypothetical protein C1645_741792 [Glomus cerebriforme]